MVQKAAAVLAVAARLARLRSLRCLAVKSRRCWATRKSGFVGGREERHDHFEGIGVGVVAEELAVVVKAVAVGMLIRIRAAFASDVAAASAPATEEHPFARAEHPFAREDMNACYRLATRSHPSTALAGRC